MQIQFKAHRQPAVIAYDVSCNRRRRKVLQVLKDWKIDGQKSVAECKLTRTEADTLCGHLMSLIDLQTDRLALIWQSAEVSPRMHGKAATGKQDIWRY